MSQVQNPLEPFQVCFLCPNGLSPMVHHVTQRNDRWSLESPNDFPPNITPLSDNVTTCIIVFPFFFTHFSQIESYVSFPLIASDGAHLRPVYGIRRWSKQMVSEPHLGCMGNLLPVAWVDPHRWNMHGHHDQQLGRIWWCQWPFVRRSLVRHSPSRCLLRLPVACFSVEQRLPSTWSIPLYKVPAH